MNAMTTYVKPKGDFMTIHVPRGYDSCAFKIVLFPIAESLVPCNSCDWNPSDSSESEVPANTKSKSANDDLKSLAGAWVPDPSEETIFAEMRTVDAELWQ